MKRPDAHHIVRTLLPKGAVLPWDGTAGALR